MTIFNVGTMNGERNMTKLKQKFKKKQKHGKAKAIESISKVPKEKLIKITKHSDEQVQPLSFSSSSKKNGTESSSNSFLSTMTSFQSGKMNGEHNVKKLKKKQKEAKTKTIGQKEKVPKDKLMKVGKPAKVNIEASPVSNDSTQNDTENSPTSFHSSLTSIQQGIEMLSWMIAPATVDNFMKQYWEKKPIYIERNDPEYYKRIISSEEIDAVLRREYITFTKNLDVTTYENGKRETHNPIGRALPPVVWDFYSQGCSLRFLNPQTYIQSVHLLNTTLQDYFNCFVGANVYLTPPESQGFAPHYDDIEAFILQVEGKKLWKVYKPRSDQEKLPRYSSPNFEQSEIGEPVMEVELKAGDMLYFPRGYIHQASTVKGHHSLHITVSTYQKHTWGDVFQKMIPKALEVAFAEDVEFRKGVPTDLFQNLGLAHYNSNAPRRNELINHIKSLFEKLCQHLPFDHAVDDFSKNFMHDALPPLTEDRERQTTIFSDSYKMINGCVSKKVDLTVDTKIRILRANILRLVEEEGKFNVYYTIENSKEYHEYEPQFMEVSEDQADDVATLIKSYPKFVAIKDLENNEESSQVISALWEKGLLCTEKPLEAANE